MASSIGFLDHGQLTVTFSDRDGAQLLARRARRNHFGGELVSADTLLVECQWRIHEACGCRNGIHGSANPHANPRGNPANPRS